MKGIIIILMACIVIGFCGCGSTTEETDSMDNSVASQEDAINNDVFVNLDNINTIYVSDCIHNLCSKKKGDIDKIISLLQSIRLEGVEAQEGADGQLNFTLNEGEEAKMSIIYYSDYLCINEQWYETEDKDAMEEVENLLLEFDKV